MELVPSVRPARCAIRSSFLASVAVVLGALTVGCKDDAPSAPSEPVVEWLTPAEHLTRASMALRGIRPSVAELEQVTADPDAIARLVDGYLDTPEFGVMIRDMHAELFMVRADTVPQLPAMGDLSGFQTQDIYASTVEEPLKLVEYVVTNDLPYSEVLQADYVLADEIVARVYGLPYDEGGPDWQVTTWVDGRPPAGVLTSSELWRRHVSNGSNFHRGRANFVADTFLCSDFANRDIVVEGGIDLSDEFAVAHAVKTNPTCVGCHQAMDPMAAFFWGWKEQLMGLAVESAQESGCHWPATNPKLPPPEGLPEDFCYPLRMYTPANEQSWQDWDLRGPGFYGQPGQYLDDLGRYIVEDPRFVSCMPRQFYAYLTQSNRFDIPFEVADHLRDVFVKTELDAKAVIREIVLSDAFRTARVVADDPSEAAAIPHVGLQTIRPEQYARTIEDLTGFVWLAAPDSGGGCGRYCWTRIDLAQTDLFGYRAMAGGIDGTNVTQPTHTATPTKVLVMARYAYEAAGYVVKQDWATSDPASRRLLTQVEPGTTDEEALREQLVSLHARILGELVAPHSPEIDASYGLLAATLASSGDTAEAWELTIAALLQDPRMMFY